MSVEYLPPADDGAGWSGRAGSGPGGTGPDGYEIGDFRPGSPGSRWALGRYLVGRAIAEYVSRALLVAALLVLALAGLLFWAGPTWAAVLILLVGLSVLAVRGLLVAVLRRVSGHAYFGPIEKRMRALVGDTGKDVRRELRRIGLPSRVWTLPLLVTRLAGRRRAETAQRLRAFELDRVVPKARLDELHLLVRSALPRR